MGASSSALPRMPWRTASWTPEVSHRGGLTSVRRRARSRRCIGCLARDGPPGAVGRNRRWAFRPHDEPAFLSLALSVITTAAFWASLVALTALLALVPRGAAVGRPLHRR